ncbi:hypothetical protein ABTB96_19595, partial [Acinetobacter baumannii]
ARRVGSANAEKTSDTYSELLTNSLNIIRRPHSLSIDSSRIAFKNKKGYNSHMIKSSVAQTKGS